MAKSIIGYFIFFIQITILLILADFYFNPKTLQPSCFSALATSDQSAKGKIIDCAVCHNQDHRDLFQSKLVGRIEILLPYDDAASIQVNFQQNFDSQQHQINPLKDLFMFSGTIFIQKRCLSYQCQDLHKIDDFHMQKRQNQQLLNSYWIEEDKKTHYSKSFPLIENVYLTKKINSKFEHIETNFFRWNSQISSFVIRFRHNVLSNMNPQAQPIFLLHLIKDNVLIRFLLIAPIILSLSKISTFLSKYHSCVKNSIIALFCLAFISQTFLAISSAIAIYILMSLHYDSNLWRLSLSSIFTVIQILFNMQYIPFFVMCLTTYIIIGFIFHVQYRHKFNDPTVFLIAFILINIIISWLFNWSILVTITPLHLMAGLATLRGQSKQQNKQSTYRTILGHQLEEEQDVMVRIDKELNR